MTLLFSGLTILALGGYVMTRSDNLLVVIIPLGLTLFLTLTLPSRFLGGPVGTRRDPKTLLLGETLIVLFAVLYLVLALTFSPEEAYRFSGFVAATATVIWVAVWYFRT